ncbi:MAG: shikimate dehydrogenase [Rickettsiales bacterium]|jgi:shikimate dehydrogenase|nr:shikimate dehydrogenase [Rickettsiales bacterium]
MRRACVIGSPIAHSLSPRLHSYWLKEYGLEGVYEKIEVSPDALADFIRTLPERFAGCNVTIPHKEAIKPMLDELDETARAIGAVNTIVIKNGKRIGMNTDAFGFRESLERGAPNMKQNKALLLGAGGAARAAAYALKEMGFTSITISNRSEQKARAITDQTISWPEREEALHDVDLLVNTTSLGMAGQPPLPLSLEKLPDHAVVCDVVYRPLETELLKDAKRRGLQTVDGLGMLLWQAVPAFEAFFGVRPDVTDTLRREVLA